MHRLILLYCGRLETLIFCACLFSFDFAFALASWQEDCFELHALSNEKIQGIKSTFQADRSITFLCTASVIASLDTSDRNSLEKQSPRTLTKIDNGEQLSTDDIKKMSQAGLSDDTIVSQIHETTSTFYLSSADIVDLKKSGVSQKVINTMIQTGNK